MLSKLNPGLYLLIIIHQLFFQNTQQYFQNTIHIKTINKSSSLHFTSLLHFHCVSLVFTIIVCVTIRVTSFHCQSRGSSWRSIYSQCCRRGCKQWSRRRHHREKNNCHKFIFISIRCSQYHQPIFDSSAVKMVQSYMLRNR